MASYSARTARQTAHEAWTRAAPERNRGASTADQRQGPEANDVSRGETADFRGAKGAVGQAEGRQEEVTRVPAIRLTGLFSRRGRTGLPTHTDEQGCLVSVLGSRWSRVETSSRTKRGQAHYLHLVSRAVRKSRNHDCQQYRTEDAFHGVESTPPFTADSGEESDQ